MMKRGVLAGVFFLVLVAAGCSPVNEKTGTVGQIYVMNRSTIQRAIQEILFRSLTSTGIQRDAKTINIFDFDHTLAHTLTKIPAKAEDGSIRYVDSKCVTLKKGEKPDFSVFVDEDTMSMPPIQQTIEKVEEYMGDGDQSVYVVTARSAVRTYTVVYEYLWKYAEMPNGVLAANSDVMNEVLWSRLKLPAGVSKLPRGAKKPLLIAAIIELTGGRVEKVRYFEDTDSYFNAGAEFLAARFPDIQFEFVDYIYTNGHYREVPAFSIQEGKIITPDGKPFTSYDSGDCPVNP